jgi:hypothetical protein
MHRMWVDDASFRLQVIMCPARTKSATRSAEINGFRPRSMRVGCARCSRCVEIQHLDAVKLYGPHAVWKDVGKRLLDDGCQVRTGRPEENGCWVAWTG